ncbi:DoxX family protein [Risungbinella massiliensis]|uniref:DoxX family protein n=1 Tax=Risungbinella massiliensis TaxID=1329796 RepID=UPI0005CC8F75|nr:DoxX family protein [Risungbinella massiliensis]
MLDLGLFLIRLVVGVLFIGHGAQKLFGWFGGYGLKGTAGWLESIGVRPGVVMATMAGLGELLGGILFASGYLLWVGAFFIVATMVVAIATVHGKNGLWVTQDGFEFNLVLIVVAIGVALAGPGAYAIGV